jgi:HK97 gp10 family phage protein
MRTETMTMARVTVTIEGIAEVARALDQLPEHLEEAGGTAIRAAMRAGGAVVRQAMERNIDAIIAAPNRDGRMVSTGVLRQSLRVRRRRNPVGSKGESYLVGPVNARYPNDQRVQAVAAMLEVGTGKRPPMPWAEPAYQATREEAMRVIVQTASERLDKLLKRYERQQARGRAR